MNIILATRDLEYGVGSVIKMELKEYDQNKKIKKVIFIGPKRLEGYSKKIKFDLIPNIGKYFVTKQPNFAFRCNNKIKKISQQQFKGIKL